MKKERVFCSTCSCEARTDNFYGDPSAEDPITLVVEDGGQRLDIWLSEAVGMSRNQLQRLIKLGRVSINGINLPGRTILRNGQTVTLLPEPQQTLDLVPENIPLDIVYQDSQIVIINKQRGLVVHPAVGHQTGTLVQALLYHCPDLSVIGGTVRPGIVHRLDMDTTGLMVVAKTEAAMNSLSEQIQLRQVERYYLALVAGGFKEDSGHYDFPIGRHPRDRKRMAVVPNGKPALTEYCVKERYGRWTLLELKLQTGRTHQIRVHLAHSGHPIVGDPLYGRIDNPFKLSAQALHAFRLCLEHPGTKQRLCWEAPPPDDFREAMRRALHFGAKSG